MDIDIPFKFSHFIVTLIIIYLSEWLKSSFVNEKRLKLALRQREIYHRKLKTMEDSDLKADMETAETIQQLEEEGEIIEEQLEGFSNDTDGDVLEQELEELEAKAHEMEALETDVQKVAAKIEKSVNKEDLEDELAKLRLVNQDLKKQIESHSHMSGLNVKLDPNLISFLDEHSDELTLSFLEKAYETMLELSAANPKMDFNQYICELKESKNKYVSELHDLHVSKREIERKFKLMKERYEEELSSFNELRIEHLFKNAGVKEYLDTLRRKNQIVEETIVNLRKDLEFKREEVDFWRQKYEQAEEERIKYHDAYRDILAKKVQLEAQRKAEKRMMSSASSMVDTTIPPPPPIEIPSVAEILGETMADM